MKAFQKKFIAVTAVAGLSVLGAACEANDTDVESPGVEEPADDTVVEGDTELDTDVDADADSDAGTDGGTDGGTDTGTDGGADAEADAEATAESTEG